ncbi:MAG: hypothetical protein RMI35_07980 [Leptospiraceae bacterium]|nr:hypothetical protein [Leptospiraceae bacterium]
MQKRTILLLTLQMIDDEVYIKALNSTLESWNDVINFCIQSDYYQKCLEYRYSKEIAAKITIIWAYLLTFSYHERSKIEKDPELFLEYASNFIKELSPYKYNKNGYDREGRKIFLSKIRKILKELKSKNSQVEDQLIFIREVIHIFSDINKFCEAYDYYRSFMFRIRPKIKEEYNYYI